MFLFRRIKKLEKEYGESLDWFRQYIDSTTSPKAKSIGYLKMALIHIKQQDWESAKYCLKKINSKYIIKTDREDYKRVINHIKYKSGRSVNKSIYSNSQLIDYNLDDLIQHIDKEHISVNGEISVFNNQISLNELVLEIPHILEKAIMVDNQYYETYRAHYDSIGFVDGIPTNTLQLIVFSGTQKVLTMYPIKDVALVHENPNHKKQKIKSQVAKFYQRYGQQND